MAAECLLCWAGGSSPQKVHTLPLCENKRYPYLGQWCSGTRALCGHSEHCGDPQANTSRCSIHIDPEGDPGQNDDKEAGDVHLDQVVAHLPLQMETSFYTGELAWGRREIHGRLLVRQGEPPVFSYCLGTSLALPRTRVLLEKENNSCCPVLKYECATRKLLAVCPLSLKFHLLPCISDKKKMLGEEVQTKHPWTGAGVTADKRVPHICVYWLFIAYICVYLLVTYLCVFIYMLSLAV